jgi:hypothetical protein
VGNTGNPAMHRCSTLRRVERRTNVKRRGPRSTLRGCTYVHH